MLDLRNRSAGYQHIYNELPFSHTDMELIVNSCHYAFLVYPERANDNRVDLIDRLRVRVFELAELHLTEKQKRVMYLWVSGMTELEIGRHLGLNQSGIHKCIYGNVSLRKPGTFYGGIVGRLRALTADDDLCRSLLLSLRETYGE